MRIYYVDVVLGGVCVDACKEHACARPMHAVHTYTYTQCLHRPCAATCCTLPCARRPPRPRTQVCAVGLLSILACPPGALPPEVAASEGLILQGVAKVLSALKQQQVRARGPARP